MKNKPNWLFGFSCALAVLGLLFSVQFKAQNSEERELYQQRQETLIVMVKNLTQRRQSLSLEMAELSLSFTTGAIPWRTRSWCFSPWARSCPAWNILMAVLK